MHITKKEARKLILLHQNLLPSRKLKGKQGIIDFIRKIGCLQFDPLNVIAMNPHLVLQSRIKDYNQDMLNELLYKERILVDGWDKNMAIHLTEEWPYFSRYRETALEVHTWRDRSIIDHLPEIRESIKLKGPVTSSDIELNHQIDWSWAPTKASRAALDLMFFTGELIIFNKSGSRKSYDFSDKYIESEILNSPDPNVTDNDYFEWGIKRRIGALGLMWNKSSEAWLGIRKLKSKSRNDAIESLLAKGEIVKITVEDVPYDFYIRKEEIYLLDMLDKKTTRTVSFIAALDNLIWDRNLIRELFDFDYKWEVYTPQKDRKYGYYVLPILFGDEFIGRIEPRFEKKTKELIILNLWFEDNVKHNSFEKAFLKAINDFKEFLGAESLIISEDTKTKLNLEWLSKILN